MKITIIISHSPKQSFVVLVKRNLFSFIRCYHLNLKLVDKNVCVCVYLFSFDIFKLVNSLWWQIDGSSNTPIAGNKWQLDINQKKKNIKNWLVKHNTNRLFYIYTFFLHRHATINRSSESDDSAFWYVVVNTPHHITQLRVCFNLQITEKKKRFLWYGTNLRFCFFLLESVNFGTKTNQTCLVGSVGLIWYLFILHWQLLYLQLE